MRTLIKYDYWYMLKTSKILIMTVVGVFFAASSALTAKFMHEIMLFAFQQEGLPFPIDALDPPTVFDSYTQFYSNFSGVFLIVCVFAGISFFTNAASKGHFPLLFSKPIKRTDYIHAKSIVIMLSLGFSLVVSGVVFGYYTWFLFDSFDIVRFGLSLIVFYVYCVFILQIALLASVVLKHPFGPLIVTLLIYFLFVSLAIISVGLFKYLPGQLVTYSMDILRNDVSIRDLSWTLGFTMLGIMGLYFFTLRAIQKKTLG